MCVLVCEPPRLAAPVENHVPALSACICVCLISDVSTIPLSLALFAVYIQRAYVCMSKLLLVVMVRALCTVPHWEWSIDTDQDRKLVVLYGNYFSIVILHLPAPLLEQRIIRSSTPSPPLTTMCQYYARYQIKLLLTITMMTYTREDIP